MYENSAVSELERPRRFLGHRRPIEPCFSSESSIVREISALQKALAAINGEASREEAQRTARKALACRTPSPLLNPRLDDVIQEALAFVAGVPLPDKPLPNPTSCSTEEHLIETASLAWLAWIRKYPTCERAEILEERPNESGALHRTTLLFWLSAINHLEASNFSEARRLWQRAIEIGSSLGTESHPAILWSYAASFFPMTTWDASPMCEGNVSPSPL